MDKKLKADAGFLATNLFFAINLSAVKYLTGNSFMKLFRMNVLRVGLSTLFLCYGIFKEELELYKIFASVLIFSGIYLLVQQL